ncbi:DEAD/DEAH box helicase family protein [uncultured Peptoniphilus sp.]|uniref:DEAD/DEAH box helicase n=1 Tax=uncultured Peptoniphilus sp. TaxID=254354 RepID=UPI0028062440|nr:DEAD/DEAH box helicase family protein [uncultured Peptoniphilus sp.]
MNSIFSEYTTDYISGVMSLRKPQEKSLKVLEEIMTSLNIKKGMNLKAALGGVHAMYPICSDFEREFLSLTFALATGVGKTRLMGAFIAYLYTNHNIKNFFVVAPGTTVYEKLKKDLSDPSNSKYLFKGLGCFHKPPEVITDDDYRTKTISFFESDVRIFVFNIDKFNKEGSKMKKINELIGESFYGYLANLEDLVLIMDESHHYRAEKGMQALNELNPLLGLELTATPIVTSGAKQIPFKNVVYEYPLSKAIEDGYTRTPFAGTRTDINFYNFGDEELDKLMIIDGLKLHERSKIELKAYYNNNNSENNLIRKVKPFMMIVCKDTDHATWVENFVKSDEFAEGLYKNKTIVVHSKQSGAESEENTRLLLDVEKYDNPVEIVIHVNMLKEGWDVNNLYTIVPLRTAASKVLREQMIGRGLRLPYGDRTGNEIVDGVYLTAHDKFQDILDEAKKGDSIFKAGNIIKLEEIEENISTTQTTSELDKDKVKEEAYAIGIEKGEKSDELIDETISHVKDEVIKEISHSNNVNISNEQKKKVAKKVKNKLKDNKELSDAYKKNENVIDDLIDKTVEQTCEETKNRFISIPRLKIIDAGVTEYGFIDFDLDLQVFNHAPVKNDLLIQNLQDFSDVKHIDVNSIDFDSFNPKKEILDLLRSKPEIDYEKSSSLLFKLISQVVSHYEEKYEAAQMKNIVFINKKDIANKIYDQMMADDHFYSENSFIKYSVMGVRDYNFPQTYTWKTQLNLYENYNENIKSILFDGIMKGVFSSAKFDSKPELILARILEKDSKVTKWLRPAQNEFNINYNRGKHYVPDFVVETEDYFYIVEVKGEDKIEDADVIAKSKKAVQFCDVVTNWAKENSKKGWKYVFIPSKEILSSSSFNNLVNRFTEV